MADEVLDLTLSDDDNRDGVDTSPPQSTTTAVKSEIQKTSSSSCASLSRRPQFNNDIDAPNVTIVNGKGFWRSWQRSFKNTLLKLLDLIDNAVDGATAPTSQDGFVGRVQIYPDIYEQSTTNRKGKKYKSTTGLCIRNNSPKKLVPLSEALVVHNTTKIDAGEK